MPRSTTPHGAPARRAPRSTSPLSTRLSTPLSALVVATLLAACNGSDGEDGATAGAGGGEGTRAAAGEQEQIEVQTSAARPEPVGKAEVLARGLIEDGRAEAQVVEAARSGGVLTVRVRFVRQAAAQEGIKTLYSGDPGEDAYLVAGDKKYFLLTDTEGHALASDGLMLDIDENRPLAGTWWGKFPAPPPEVTTVSVILPGVESIDAVPLADR